MRTRQIQIIGQQTPEFWSC